MTSEQIIAVINAAKAAGISWLKADGLEFGAAGPAIQPILSESHKIANLPIVEDELLPEEEEKIKHKVEELKSVMALGDLELIDRLFPEPKEETEAAS